jgi:membrane-associated protease RseP (regulator of RpoE activity)
MSQPVAIVAFIVSILLVVVVHEAGHFTAAKAFGIKVQEFFVGFGPRLWSFRRGETEYGFKALPLGGYVRIAGMNPFEETPPEDIPRTYGAKPIWQRALVILAGPITHFVIALFVLTIYFVAVGYPLAGIGKVDPTLNGAPSPAAVAGFRAGDVVVAVGPIANPDEGRFISYTRAHVGRSIAITVKRDGGTIILHATPVLAKVGGQEVGRLGIELSAQPLGRARTNPFTAVGRAAITVGSMTKQVVLRLGDVFGPRGIARIWDLITGAPRTSNDVGSVVEGARLAGQAAQVGAWDFLLFLFASFNIFVGILNLLPLPPLDGGHLAVLAVEKVSHKSIDPRRLLPVTAVVAGFMILFMVSLVYLDIVNPVPNPFR